MFARLGITALRTQALNDMLAALGLPTLLRRSPERALAYAVAGGLYGLYGYLDNIAKQAVPWSATGGYLKAWAGLIGVSRKPATAATGTATVFGAVGKPVPIGTAFRAAGGMQYTSTADVAVGSDGSAVVPIIAATVGATGSLTPNTPLALASPLDGVQTLAVGNSTAPGADAESDDPFRTRMLLRWASPPQGGSAADYVEWLLAVAGITRAWVNPNGAGAGTVVVYTMWDVSRASADPTTSGFPQGSDGVAGAETRGTRATGDQLTAANAVYPLRPVTARVISCAPLPYPVAFAFLTRSIVPQGVQAAALAALDDVFVAIADPLGGVLDTSPFETALAAVAGMPRFTLTAPAVEVQAPLGYLPVRGAVTWTVAS